MIFNSFQKNQAHSYVDKIFDEGGRPSISKHREKRSLDQNRLYWMWINCIHDETGNDKDFLHKYFREQFIGVEKKTVFGVEITEPISTTTLNTKKFTEYLDLIQVFASQQGIILPDPQDKHWNEFYETYKDRL